MKIEGAKLIGSTWHYYKRVPKRLVDAYRLPEFRRGTMGTKDPKKAAEKARAMLSEHYALEQKLDSLPERVKLYSDLMPLEQDRLKRDIAAKVASLPNDQRNLLQKEGGDLEALRAIDEVAIDTAFLFGTTRAAFELKDEFGEDYEPDEREDQEDLERIKLKRLERRSNELNAALVAAGVVEPKVSSVKGLRSLLEKYCEAKGYVHADGIKDKTRGQYEYAVRRFVEYHGDLALSDLTRKHLSDFALDYLKLPKSSRKDVRPLAFWDAARIAEREDLPCVSERTRDQNLALLKSLMAFAVNEGYVEGGDPWAGYSPTVAKQKVSEKHSTKRHLFTVDEIRLLAAHASEALYNHTIDHWGPLLGAFHGVRLEEVAQFRVADAVEAEGMLCLSVTDEGPLQKVKNENTFRVIPVHEGLID